MWWSPPNGSRLSCGRLARRRKSSGRQSVPARAQRSVSLKAITARQLQALVRRRALSAPAPRETDVHEWVDLRAMLETRTRTVADIDRVQECCSMRAIGKGGLRRR